MSVEEGDGTGNFMLLLQRGCNRFRKLFFTFYVSKDTCKKVRGYALYSSSLKVVRRVAVGEYVTSSELAVVMVWISSRILRVAEILMGGDLRWSRRKNSSTSGPQA